MARFLKSRAKAQGAAPGELIFMGLQRMSKTRIRLFQYDEEHLQENELKSVSELLKKVDNAKINWINIDGVHNTDLVQGIGSFFHISPIVLENIVNTDQRPKFFEDNVSISFVLKSIAYDENNDKIGVEQISLVLVGNVLISFQESVGNHFDPVRTRLRNAYGRIRKSSADYLLYTLIDSLVDNYLINLEKLGERIESQGALVENPTKEIGHKLFHLKTEVAFFNKNIRPLKEVLTRFLRSGILIEKNNNALYYQELFDLTQQANEAADSYYTMANDLINLYNTNLGHHENQVMKVLTVFASIFIPLTFIAGVYGTNFEYLPELDYKYAYYVMWTVMIIVAGGMLLYFRRQKWF